MKAKDARCLKVGDWVQARFSGRGIVKACQITDIRWPRFTLATTDCRGREMIRERLYRSLEGKMTFDMLPDNPPDKELYEVWEREQIAEDICGFCGQPGADKVPHPVRWPGEESAGTEYVHAECEQEECRRAHAALTDRQREEFLRSVSHYG